MTDHPRSSSSGSNLSTRLAATRALIALVLMVVTSAAAYAGWGYSISEDPIQGDVYMSMAVDLETGYGAAFRCFAGENTDLTLIFVTPERIPQSSVSAIRAMPIKLLVIVDNQPQVEIDATAYTVGEANLLRIKSSDAAVSGLVKAAIVAKKHFAITAQITNKIVYSHTFDLQGSKQAIGEMAAACKLQSNSKALRAS